MKGGAVLSKGRTGTGHFLFIFLILGAKRRKLGRRTEVRRKQGGLKLLVREQDREKHPQQNHRDNKLEDGVQE